MTKKIRVYGWQSFRREAVPAPNGSRQTREIVVARSVAEVMRITGMTRTAFGYAGGETGNQKEIDQAMTEPGAVFWTELDNQTNWRRG